LQAKSQGRVWAKLALQLSTVSSKLTYQLQKELVPQTWGAVQKGFDIMVEVYKTKLKQKDIPSVRDVLAA
jgi:hypothetical protein